MSRRDLSQPPNRNQNRTGSNGTARNPPFAADLSSIRNTYSNGDDDNFARNRGPANSGGTGYPNVHRSSSSHQMFNQARQISADPRRAPSIQDPSDSAISDFQTSTKNPRESIYANRFDPFPSAVQHDFRDRNEIGQGDNTYQSRSRFRRDSSSRNRPLSDINLSSIRRSDSHGYEENRENYDPHQQSWNQQRDQSVQGTSSRHLQYSSSNRRLLEELNISSINNSERSGERFRDSSGMMEDLDDDVFENAEPRANEPGTSAAYDTRRSMSQSYQEVPYRQERRTSIRSRSGNERSVSPKPGLHSFDNSRILQNLPPIRQVEDHPPETPAFDILGRQQCLTPIRWRPKPSDRTTPLTKAEKEFLARLRGPEKDLDVMGNLATYKEIDPITGEGTPIIRRSFPTLFADGVPPQLQTKRASSSSSYQTAQTSTQFDNYQPPELLRQRRSMSQRPRPSTSSQNALNPNARGNVSRDPQVEMDLSLLSFMSHERKCEELGAQYASVANTSSVSNARTHSSAMTSQSKPSPAPTIRQQHQDERRSLGETPKRNCTQNVRSLSRPRMIPPVEENAGGRRRSGDKSSQMASYSNVRTDGQTFQPNIQREGPIKHFTRSVFEASPSFNRFSSRNRSLPWRITPRVWETTFVNTASQNSSVLHGFSEIEMNGLNSLPTFKTDNLFKAYIDNAIIRRPFDKTPSEPSTLREKLDYHWYKFVDKRKESAEYYKMRKEAMRFVESREDHWKNESRVKINVTWIQRHYQRWRQYIELEEATTIADAYFMSTFLLLPPALKKREPEFLRLVYLS